MECVEGAESEGFSHGEIPVQVQTLDDAVVELLSCPEPIDDELLMAAQHLGDVFHRFDFASHRAETPALEEFLRPGGVSVVPEALEVLRQEVGFDGPQVHRQEFGQLQSLCGR